MSLNGRASILCVNCGVLAGLGSYTFHYAAGTSYFVDSKNSRMVGAVLKGKRGAEHGHELNPDALFPSDRSA